MPQTLTLSDVNELELYGPPSINLRQVPNSFYENVDGDFSKLIKKGGEKISYAFPGEDTTNIIFEQDYTCGTSYYPHLVPRLNSRHPFYKNLYFTGDENISDNDNQQRTFTRTYSNIPGLLGNNLSGSQFVRKIPSSTVVTVPGVDIAAGGITYFIDPSTISYSGDQKSASFSVYQGWTHNLVSPDYNYAQINYQLVQQSSGSVPVKVTYFFNQNSYLSPIFSRTGTSITVRALNNVTGSGIIYESFSRPQIVVNSYQKVVNSFIYKDYWLESVNIDSILNIPIVQSFKIFDAALSVRDSLSEYSNPSLAEYRQRVASNELVCIQDSTIERWKGLIFERSTVFAYLPVV